MDPSIVGSLDNVYKDEPSSYMKEDPFKKVPMMDDHEKPASMMEMEKSVDAMVALVEHTPGSPVPEDATSLDTALRHPMDENFLPSEDLPDFVGSRESNTTGSIPLDLATGSRQSVDLLEEASKGGGDPTCPSQPVDLTKGAGLGLTVMSSS